MPNARSAALRYCNECHERFDRHIPEWRIDHPVVDIPQGHPGVRDRSALP